MGSANNTDHALVRASVRLRLKKIHRLQRTPRIDPLRLKTAAGERFRFELHNRFEHLAELAPKMQFESEWEELKSSVFEAAVTNIGHSSRRRWDLLSTANLAVVEARKAASTSRRLG